MKKPNYRRARSPAKRKIKPATKSGKLSPRTVKRIVKTVVRRRKSR